VGVQAWRTLHFIEPGKLVQNAYAESLNGRLRDECLNGISFTSPADARTTIESWRRDYNEGRTAASSDLHRWNLPKQYKQVQLQLQPLDQQRLVHHWGSRHRFVGAHADSNATATRRLSGHSRTVPPKCSMNSVTRSSHRMSLRVIGASKVSPLSSLHRLSATYA
jgi:hypothetical protein